MNDKTSRQQQAEEAEVQASFRFSVAIVSSCIPIDQDVRNLSGARLSDQATERQRNAKQKSILRSIEVVQAFGDRGCSEHKNDGTISVGGHVVHARNRHSHIFEHLEVVGEIG